MSEVHFASVTGVVCAKGLVSAVHPKDECFQCQQRAYVVGYGRDSPVSWRSRVPSAGAPGWLIRKSMRLSITGWSYGPT